MLNMAALYLYELVTYLGKKANTFGIQWDAEVVKRYLDGLNPILNDFDNKHFDKGCKEFEEFLKANPNLTKELKELLETAQLASKIKAAIIQILIMIPAIVAGAYTGGLATAAGLRFAAIPVGAVTFAVVINLEEAAFHLPLSNPIQNVASYMMAGFLLKVTGLAYGRANASNSASIIAADLIQTSVQPYDSSDFRPFSGGTHGCYYFRGLDEEVFSRT